MGGTEIGDWRLEIGDWRFFRCFDMSFLGSEIFGVALYTVTVDASLFGRSKMSANDDR